MYNRTGIVRVVDAPSGSAHFGDTGVEVPMTTIDSEVARLNLTLRFVKADVEGDELEMLEVAIETMKTQRPILCVALYHPGLEILRVPRLVRELGGYELRFHMEAVRAQHPLGELRLFAVPNEIAGLRLKG